MCFDFFFFFAKHAVNTTRVGMILLLLIHQDKFQLQVVNLVFTVAQYKCQQRRMEDDWLHKNNPEDTEFSGNSITDQKAPE